MSETTEHLQNEVDRLKERVTEIEHRLDGEGAVEVDKGLRDFVESFGPTSHTERSLCIAHYLERYREMDNVSISDIRQGYRECRVNPASNMRDVLSRMREKDWLLQDGESGQTRLWRVSATGQEAVEEGIKNVS